MTHETQPARMHPVWAIISKDGELIEQYETEKEARDRYKRVHQSDDFFYVSELMERAEHDAAMAELQSDIDVLKGKVLSKDNEIFHLRSKVAIYEMSQTDLVAAKDVEIERLRGALRELVDFQSEKFSYMQHKEEKERIYNNARAALQSEKKV